MKIKNVIFDLDDTLIKEENSAAEAFYRVCNEVKSKYGINEDDFFRVIRKTSREVWHTCPVRPYCLNVGISSWEGLWAEFTGHDKNLMKLNEWKYFYRFKSWNNALLQFDINDKVFTEKIANIFIEARRSISIVFPDVKAELKRIKEKYRVGLLTNGTPDLQWFKIKKAELEEYFHSILVSGEIGFGKPDRRIFKEIIRQLGSNFDSSVMIGDSMKTDIKGAKNLSIKTIWINRKNKRKKDGIEPDRVINDFNGLLEIINEL